MSGDVGVDGAWCRVASSAGSQDPKRLPMRPAVLFVSLRTKVVQFRAGEACIVPEELLW